MSEARRSVRVGAILRDVIEAALLAAGLFLVLQFAVQNTIVDGPSMEPNFADQQWLLVNKLAYRRSLPRRGDVIVFHAPDGSRREFIKRVVALPGESVAVRDGAVYVGGSPIEEPWFPRHDESAFGPYTVPPGKVFVMGDNRPNSNDSRSWGPLDASAIIGKAFLSVWPREAWGVVPTAGPGPLAAERSAE
jgi:signal peptidase I